MTPDQINFIRAVVAVMRGQRNRFGRIQPDRDACKRLHEFVYSFGRLPHGGEDSIDKAQMLLSLMIGDQPISVQD